MKNKFKVASVHGRFQPLHLDHLKYILEAKKRCDFLYIGITQYNILTLIDTPGDHHRQVPQNNPLTYFERIQIIRNALINEGIKLSEFMCIPFPIETPQYLTNFIPNNIPIFTTVCEEWNRRKINLLKDHGYKVIVLYEEDVKKYEGIKIRKQILEDNAEWKKSVPQATINAVKEYNIQKRIKELSKNIEI